MHTKKTIPIDGKWAALMRTEVSRIETAFPPDALTFDQVREMLKGEGLPWGKNQTWRWLRDQRAAGKIKRLTGTQLSDGKSITATRYQCV